MCHTITHAGSWVKVVERKVPECGPVLHAERSKATSTDAEYCGTTAV